MNGLRIVRFGCGVPATLIAGSGVGALVHAVWPQIPVWPFALAGLFFHLAFQIFHAVLVPAEMWLQKMADTGPEHDPH